MPCRARLLAVFFLALAPGFAAERPQDGVVMIHNEDPGMQEAIRRARAGLEEFLALAREQPAGTSQFTVKVAIRGGGMTEYVWVVPFRATAGGFEGVLRNEPQFAPHLRLGQNVTFTREDIADWGYKRDGRHFGYFTQCVLYGRARGEVPAATREFYKALCGY